MADCDRPEFLDLHVNGVMRLTVHIESNLCGGQAEGPANITEELKHCIALRSCEHHSTTESLYCLKPM